MEALFILEPIDKLDMQSSRYLPPTTIRILLDEQGNSLDIENSTINENQDRVASEIIKQIINMKSDAIRALLEKSRNLAEDQVRGDGRDELTDPIDRVGLTRPVAAVDHAHHDDLGLRVGLLSAVASGEHEYEA